MKKLLVFLLVLAGIYTVAAKGVFQKVDITTESDEAVTITDPVLLEGLSMGILMDLGRGPIDPPEEVGERFELIRYFGDGEGKYKAFDLVHFYTDPAGGTGYIYYDGLEGGWSEFDDNWYQVTEAGAEAMETVITEYLTDEASSSERVTIPAIWRWNCTASAPESAC